MMLETIIIAFNIKYDVDANTNSRLYLPDTCQIPQAYLYASPSQVDEYLYDLFGAKPISYKLAVEQY